MNVEKLHMYICNLLSFPFPPLPYPTPPPHPIPNHNKIGYYLNDWCPSDSQVQMACFPSRNIEAKILTWKTILAHVYTASPDSGRVTWHFKILWGLGVSVRTWKAKEIQISLCFWQKMFWLFSIRASSNSCMMHLQWLFICYLKFHLQLNWL